MSYTTVRRVGWWRDKGLLVGVLRCGGLGQKVSSVANDVCGPCDVLGIVLVVP